MKKLHIWLIVLASIMLVSFMISGLFFMASGMINPATGYINDDRAYELWGFSLKMARYFGIQNIEAEMELAKESEGRFNLTYEWDCGCEG